MRWTHPPSLRSVGKRWRRSRQRSGDQTQDGAWACGGVHGESALLLSDLRSGHAAQLQRLLEIKQVW